MNKIEIQLTDDQLNSLHSFASEFSYWHLDDLDISDELAVLLCIMYTAVGPIRPDEVGVCGLDAVEIDDQELKEFAKQWLKQGS